jgi:D-xylose 1-dehydrogenase (NADP+, D-xylono-1,5-lactone-forming)
MAANMADRIRWGVISTSNIAEVAVIPAIQSSRNGIVLGVASRDHGRARQYADRLKIERAYGSYEELLADPDIDAIYNPLPNHGHVPWSAAAAKAGKPTLVEKPIGITAAEAQQLVDTFRAEGVLLAEAFMYRYHPQHAEVRKLIKDGAIGTLNLISAHFTYSMPFDNTTNVRLNPEIGGGGLLDVGCYCVNASRMLTGEEPDAVTGQVVIGKTSGVDELFVGTLHFPSGAMAHFDCGMRSSWRNEYRVTGTDGTITVDAAFRPEDDGVAAISVRSNDGKARSIEIPASNQYRLMVEDFGDAVKAGRKVTYDPADSVRNMRVLDALTRAAKEGRTVAV